MAYAMGPREDKALFDAAGSDDADGVARAINAGANLDWPAGFIGILVTV